MAATLVRSAMACIGKEQPAILCCDSRYPQGAVLELSEEFDNLTLICNVRSDTALYDLPPPRTGTRGCPNVHRDKLTLENFNLFDVQNSDYSVRYRRGLTQLFGKKPVLATMTKPSSGQSKRLFLCPNATGNFHFDLEFCQNIPVHLVWQMPCCAFSLSTPYAGILGLPFTSRKPFWLWLTTCYAVKRGSSGS